MAYLKGDMNREGRVWSWLAEIPDPEIPVVSITDLGIVREVRVLETDEKDKIRKVNISITPTYTGCPAMDVIAMQIRMNLSGRGVKEVQIQEQLSPAWSTDWITTEGLEKMKRYGIAPPVRKAKVSLGLFEEDEIECPRCRSLNTILISNFGATSCKAMYQCKDCHEPFEHFKCH